MTIQTVITDNEGNVYVLDESPAEVEKAFRGALTGVYDMSQGISSWESDDETTYWVTSYEEWISVHKAELSDFCPPVSKKGIWWLAIQNVEYLFSRTTLGASQYQKIMIDYRNSQSKIMVNHFHVTLDFNVTYEGNAYCAWAVDEGETTFPVLVKGLAYNDKCAALVVELKGIESCNARPHITLATAEGVKPVYSNDMLAGVDGAYHFLPLEAELEGQLEFFEFS